MARRKPATIADENGFFAPPAPPALIRMERERGEPRTADVHSAEAAKWTAKGWKPVMTLYSRSERSEASPATNGRFLGFASE